MSVARRKLPSLQQLVAFEAAVRRNSFTKAADELSLTQSAISKQIHQLEHAVGLTLFDRAGGRVTLTEAGQVYLRAAKDILTQFRVAALSVGGGSAGTAINVVALPTFASQWLIPRLQGFLGAYSKFTVNLITRVQPFDFYGGSYDVAIAYGAANWTHPDAAVLCEEYFVPVAAPAYRKREKLKRPADLGRAVLLQQADRVDLWAEWFVAANINRDDAYRGPVFDRFSITIVAALAGLGVALVPRFLVEQEVASGKLVVLSDRAMKGNGAYHVVVPRNKASTPGPATFRRWLLRESASALALTGRRTTVRNRPVLIASPTSDNMHDA